MTPTPPTSDGTGQSAPPKALRAVRERATSTRGGRLAWRVVITILGVSVVVIGVVLLALPGPGWLIIFAGLGILATEFEWASRLLARARAAVRRWTSWIGGRNRPVQAVIGLLGMALLAALALGSWYLVGT